MKCTGLRATSWAAGMNRDFFFFGLPGKALLESSPLWPVPFASVMLCEAVFRTRSRECRSADDGGGCAR